MVDLDELKRLAEGATEARAIEAWNRRLPLPEQGGPQERRE